MKPGDVVTGDNGKRWVLGAMLAYQGKAGCHNLRCTRMGGEDGCRGYHCPKCDEPCSSMGHNCPEDGDA